MAFQRRCDACDYRPLIQHTNIRPPPWLPEGRSHVLYVCRVCGSTTIQSYDSQTSFGQLWLLEPGAMSLLRLHASPREVTEYLSSEDFFANRAITEGLFRSWVRATIDVSMCINDLLARMHACVDPRRLEVMVSQLAFAIQTVTQRRFDQVDVGCRISGIEPLFQALHGGFPHANASPETVSKIRLDALDTLENLARPWMWELVPDSERQTLEYALDHFVLVEQSRQEVALARQQMHSDGPLKVREEVLFLQGLFSRRDAYLTVNYASLLWGCLRDFYQRMGNVNTSSLQKAYDVVQRLLEGQLVARGLEPVSWHPEEGAAYQVPRTGEVVFLRRRTPQVEVYASLRSTEPNAVHDAWFDVLEWITQRLRQSNGAS